MPALKPTFQDPPGNNPSHMEAGEKGARVAGVEGWDPQEPHVANVSTKAATSSSHG